MMKHAAAAFLFLAFAGPGAAMADDDCRVPMDQWQPREAVQKMAESRGWKVSRIKIDDGCYEIKGTDETGQKIKAKLNPATLATVKLKRKGQSENARDMHEGGEPAASPGAGGEFPVNGLFKPGHPPKVEVK